MTTREYLADSNQKIKELRKLIFEILDEAKLHPLDRSNLKEAVKLITSIREGDIRAALLWKAAELVEEILPLKASDFHPSFPDQRINPYKVSLN